MLRGRDANRRRVAKATLTGALAVMPTAARFSQLSLTVPRHLLCYCIYSVVTNRCPVALSAAHSPSRKKARARSLRGRYHVIMIRNFGDMNTHYSVAQIDDGEGDPDAFRCWPGAGVRRGTTSGTAGRARTWQGRARRICSRRCTRAARTPRRSSALRCAGESFTVRTLEYSVPAV